MRIIDDPLFPEPQAAFPVDNPIQALLRDHNLVRSLADRYLKSDSMAVKAEAAKQLLQAIQMHSRLEESVFYPGVRCIEPNLIAGFEEEHLNADELLMSLQGLAPDSSRVEPLMRELITVVLSHIDEEETELFPMLQNAALDMTPIGLEMQAFEANMLRAQARMSNGGMRR